MPDVRRAYDVYEAYEVWGGIFLTPSAARLLLPPPAGGPPPSMREVLGDSPVKASGLAVDWI